MNIFNKLSNKLFMNILNKILNEIKDINKCD